jgi:histidinol-phosphate aminotransferase
MVSFIRPDLAKLVAYTPQPHAAEADRPHEIDRLDANESPYDLPSSLKQELAQKAQQAITANRYPDGGHEPLKRAIAEYVAESANLPIETIAPTHISLGNGSDELIRSLLITTCLGNQGSVLVADPTFSMYAILARTLGIPVVNVPRSPVDFTINLAEAEVAIAQPTGLPVRVLFLVHPNSPTGNLLTQVEVDWLKTLPDNLLIVIDEAYFEFSQTTLLAELLHHPNWVILRTFSKAFCLAAYRVGYAIGHPAAIAALEKTRLPYNLPSLSQTAAQLVLTHRAGVLQPVASLLTERDRLLQALRAQPQIQVWPSAGNFIYARCRDVVGDRTDKDLLHYLSTQGTLIRHTGGGLRITVGTPEQNTRTVTRLNQFFQ